MLSAASTSKKLVITVRYYSVTHICAPLSAWSMSGSKRLAIFILTMTASRYDFL